MTDTRGLYNRLYVILAYLFLVGLIAWFSSWSVAITLSSAEKFLNGAVFPVLGYILIKGQGDQTAGTYIRTILVMAYLILVGWIVYLISTSDNITMTSAERFLVNSALPVFTYVLIKGPKAVTAVTTTTIEEPVEE